MRYDPTLQIDAQTYSPALNLWALYDSWLKKHPILGSVVFTQIIFNLFGYNSPQLEAQK
jgi:hypothetical protein